ncbi:unannotated protein [freshwater metagenome]|uniref:Unannotated protein n=1 Tax=freshwater metagenome TaxID=449393 RepID=A0A6J7QMA6_9ZZZZ
MTSTAPSRSSSETIAQRAPLDFVVLNDTDVTRPPTLTTWPSVRSSDSRATTVQSVD